MRINGIIELADILEHSNDGFFVTDARGKLLYRNSATNPLVGIDIWEFKSMDYLLKNKLIDRSTALEAIQRKSTVSGEVISITGNRVIATSTLVYDPKGNPDGVICNVRDVSDDHRHEKDDHILRQIERISSDYKIVQIRGECHNFELAYSSNSMGEIVSLATDLGKVDSTVLLCGETGVGKELIARLIYDRSPKTKRGPFVKVNCASIPVNLVETELFGYEPGSFTGALKKGRKGFFELADGGTLFLDEIAELPLEVQPKLLNVLQDRQVLRVGSAKPRPIDVRIIAATNRNLKKMIAEGKLREDLYYRLNVIPVKIPPLRDRKTEIPMFISYFQNIFQRKYALGKKEISKDIIKHLYWYPWPGNVRELANLVERLLIISKEEVIKMADLPSSYLKCSQQQLKDRFTVHDIAPLKDMTREFELAVINKAMEQSKNQKEAAEILGISSSSLSRKLNV